MNIDLVSPAGASLGEGSLWDAARGIVWWIDIKGPALHAHRPADGSNHAQRLDLRLTALGLDAAGGLIAAGDAGFVRLHVGDDLAVSVGEVVARPDEPVGNRFNDGKVDPQGRFWAGTMDDAEEHARGTLYRLDPDARVEPVRRGIMVPNGPAFLADGTMLTSDTARGIVTAVTLDERGDPVSERTFATFAEHMGYPDGMTVDAHDHVWIAFWDGWCLRRIAPDGAIVDEVRLPVQRPTCPTFAGDRLDTLYVTSAAVGLTDAELTQQPWAGGLLRLQPGVHGRAPTPFGALPAQPQG